MKVCHSVNQKIRWLKANQKVTQRHKSVFQWPPQTYQLAFKTAFYNRNYDLLPNAWMSTVSVQSAYTSNKLNIFTIFGMLDRSKCFCIMFLPVCHLRFKTEVDERFFFCKTRPWWLNGMIHLVLMSSTTYVEGNSESTLDEMPTCC